MLVIFGTIYFSINLLYIIVLNVQYFNKSTTNVIVKNLILIPTKMNPQEDTVLTDQVEVWIIVIPDHSTPLNTPSL